MFLYPCLEAIKFMDMLTWFKQLKLGALLLVCGAAAHDAVIEKKVKR